jgi:hypothetical protein
MTFCTVDVASPYFTVNMDIDFTVDGNPTSLTVVPSADDSWVLELSVLLQSYLGSVDTTPFG